MATLKPVAPRTAGRTAATEEFGSGGRVSGNRAIRTQTGRGTARKSTERPFPARHVRTPENQGRVAETYEWPVKTVPAQSRPVNSSSTPPNGTPGRSGSIQRFVSAPSPDSKLTKATEIPPAGAMTDQEVKQAWESFRNDLFTRGLLPQHFQKQAAIALQQALDPDLKIPLIVTGVTFDGNGVLQSISVVKAASTNAFIATHKISAEAVANGTLQGLEANPDVPVPVKQVSLNDDVSWKNSRIGKTLAKRGETRDKARDRLNRIVVQSLVQKRSELTARLPTLVGDLSDQLRNEVVLKTEGLFRISASEKTLTSKLEMMVGGASVTETFGEAADPVLLADSLKRLLAHRSDTRVSVEAGFKAEQQILGKDAGAVDPGSAIDGMLERLSDAERDLWHRIVNLLHDVQKEKSVNLMNATNLAKVFAPHLFGSKDVQNPGPVQLLAYLIEHAPDYFPRT